MVVIQMDHEVHWTPDTALRTLKEFYAVPGSAIAYAGAYKIYQYFDGVLPLKRIKSFLHSQNTYTLHSEKPKRARSFVPVKVYAKRALLELDLLDVSNLSEWNDSIKYLFVCIDVFTRYIFIHICLH